MFKKGDKVRVIKSDHSSINEVGDEGTIVEVNSKLDGYRVEVSGNGNSGNWHYGYELELVKSNNDNILEHKLNAEEDYNMTTINVLKYIELLESKLGIIDLRGLKNLRERSYIKV
jgi:hypothetical protein